MKRRVCLEELTKGMNNLGKRVTLWRRMRNWNIQDVLHWTVFATGAGGRRNDNYTQIFGQNVSCADTSSEMQVLA